MMSVWPVNEEWRDVTGFEGLYKVSSMGRVLSCERVVKDSRLGKKKLKERFLKPTVDSFGYTKVTLFRDSKRSVRKVHRLVAGHFCYKPEGCDVVNHIDNDTQNNQAGNLEWTTNQGNTDHMIAQGRKIAPKGQECSWTDLTESDVIAIKGLCREGVKQSHIAKKYGVSQPQVSKIHTGKDWSHITC